MIVQGTTPTHAFTLPFETDLIKTARFVYSEGDEAKLIKKMETIVMDGKEVSTTLSQEDTFKFTPGRSLELVLRVLLLNGESVSTKPVVLRVRGSADKEVLV